MNVLFLTRLYKPHIGGVERHVEGICRVLAKRHEIKIITEKYEKEQKDYGEIEGIEVYRMPKGNKWQIWQWMRKNKYLLD